LNGRLFDSLTPKEQKIILDAAKEAGAYNDKLSIAMEKDLVEKMKKSGTTFIEVNREDFRNKVKNAPYILEDKGVWPKGLYDRAKKI